MTSKCLLQTYEGVRFDTTKAYSGQMMCAGEFPGANF